jgi:hypothetical protein
MTTRFAENTEVSVERSRAELEGLLAKHGATQRATYADDETGRAAVQFRMGDAKTGRMVRLEVVVPRLESYLPREGAFPPGWKGWSPAKRTDWMSKRYEQGARTAWRRLLLVVKAKLEIIADGGSTFEREFLADILLPDGQTVHEALESKLEESYRTGGMPKLLLGPGGE